MNKKQFQKIRDWQNKTFGRATVNSKIEHLREELIEVENDYKNKNPEINLEFADCFMLLYGAAAAAGLSYDDITKAIETKYKINLQRQWGEPDKNGVVKHLKTKN